MHNFLKVLPWVLTSSIVQVSVFAVNMLQTSFKALMSSRIGHRPMTMNSREKSHIGCKCIYTSVTVAEATSKTGGSCMRWS